MADAIHHGANERYPRLEIIAKPATVLEVERIEFVKIPKRGVEIERAPVWRSIAGDREPNLATLVRVCEVLTAHRRVSRVRRLLTLRNPTSRGFVLRWLSYAGPFTGDTVRAGPASETFPESGHPHTWDRPGRADPKLLIAARETWNAVSDDAFQFVVL